MIYFFIYYHIYIYIWTISIYIDISIYLFIYLWHVQGKDNCAIVYLWHQGTTLWSCVFFFLWTFCGFMEWNLAWDIPLLHGFSKFFLLLKYFSFLSHLNILCFQRRNQKDLLRCRTLISFSTPESSAVARGILGLKNYGDSIIFLSKGESGDPSKMWMDLTEKHCRS